MSLFLSTSGAFAPSGNSQLYRPSDLTVIPPAQEGSVLAPLPLYLLGGSADVALSLDLWGIRTFGEFAALPPIRSDGHPASPRRECPSSITALFTRRLCGCRSFSRPLGHSHLRGIRSSTAHQI